MKELLKLLDEYYSRFGKSYPMMQSPGNEKAVEHIKESLRRDKSVEELYPEVYGELIGKNKEYLYV